MRLPGSSDIHLTYCLNIHRGESWSENFAAIREHALRVRQAVAPDAPFGLGLRLSSQAAAELANPGALGDFAAFLDDHGLYAFTINGFPYGRFHATAVKQDVYAPDWRTPQRRDYTNTLIDILAALLPEGAGGSVSTVPGAYAPWIRTPDDRRRMAAMLTGSAAHADRIRRQTGRDIRIALEPEPDCFIETIDQAARYLGDELPAAARDVASEIGIDADSAERIIRHHVGACVDTAHAAVQFERPDESLARLAKAGVRVGKVQLSSALRLLLGPDALDRLEAFVDPVYLHQVKLRRADGGAESFADLPAAIEAARRLPEPTRCEMRVHFHVPLFFTSAGPLSSTSDLLGEEFWSALAGSDAPTDHLEIETYTFDVLPDDLRTDDVVESIRREYEWVLGRWAAAHR